MAYGDTKGSLMFDTDPKFGGFAYVRGIYPVLCVIGEKTHSQSGSG